jgi:hypothetical protein
MLILNGPPESRPQRGMPAPAVRFALAVPAQGRVFPVVLHGIGCERLPHYEEAGAQGLSRIVYSTTLDELDEYAGRQFAEDEWMYCPECCGETS